MFVRDAYMHLSVSCSLSQSAVRRPKTLKSRSREDAAMAIITAVTVSLLWVRFGHLQWQSDALCQTGYGRVV